MNRPLVKPNPTPRPAEPPLPPLPQRSALLGKSLGEVLIVDAVSANRQVLRRLLRLLNPDVKVREASSLADGVAEYRRQVPNLLLLNNHLPDGQAVDLLRELTRYDSDGESPTSSRRRRRGEAACPIIVLSASNSADLVVRLLRAGASDCLSKHDLKVAGDGAWQRASGALSQSVTRAREWHRLACRGARLREHAISKRRDERAAREEARRLLVAAETAHREAEGDRRRLAGVLENLPAAVFVAEAPSGRVVLANDARVQEVLRAPAFSAQDVEVYTYWKGWHADGRPIEAHEWPLARAVAGETVRGEELQFEFGDGERGWLLASGGPIRDGQGKVIAGLVSIQDITQRREGERALRESEQRNREQFAELNAVYAAVPVGLAYIGSDLRHRRVNHAMAAIDGRTVESYAGRHAGEVLPPELWQQIEPALRRVLDRGETVKLEISGRPGSVPPKEPARDYLAVYSPVGRGDGKITGINMVVQDVTETKRAEDRLAEQAQELALQRAQLEERNQELVRLNTELTRASAQLQALLVNAPVGFAFFDREYRYLRINGPLADINGMSAEEHLGRTIRDAQPGVADGMEPLLERVFRTGRSVVGAEIEGETPKLPGHRRWWLASYFPVVESGAAARPGVSAVGCVVLEITDRKRAEQMLREAKENAVSARISADRAREAAERANRAKSEFLAVLSHELRTPLTPVLAGTQMLERELRRSEQPDATPAAFGIDNLDEEGREMLGETLSMIRRNVELEVRLIDDLLDLTRITRGKLQLSRRPIDINDAARHVVEICRPDVEDKQLRLETQLSPGPLGAVADPARVQQVMWNLVKNAVKFTPEGGTIRVRTFAATTGGGKPLVGCEVSDNGLGIETDKLRTIFNAFEQGGHGVTRTFGGLGLGLAISRYLIDAHGGSLVARSEGSGRGSQFTMTLPARSVKPTAPAAEPQAPGKPSGMRRILLVEDHVDTAKLMSRFLKLRLGATVNRAGTISEARQNFEEAGPFDLIISDIGLPDGTGNELLLSLPAERPPAIALSGYGTESDVQRSRDAGFADHLVKPVDLDRLDQTVRRVLGG